MNNSTKCSDASKACVRNASVLTKHFGISTLLFFIISAIFIGCGPSREEKEYQESSQQIADSVSTYMKGIATDTINGITHNFIKKANLKFKVQNVLTSSKKIEDLVFTYGGYISSSELTSNKNHTESIQIHKDSILEQTYYTTVNYINIRVPSQKLDTVLRQISDLALFIDYRNLNSDDVKMKLFSNKLAENRYANYKQQVRTNVVKKQSQVLATEENVLQKQTIADEKRIESFDLADQVNYSTITIEVYQSQTVMKQVIAMQDQVEPYQPSFFNKLGHSFLNGFKILKDFILFLINIWGLILILVVLGFIIKRFVVYVSKK